MILRRTQSLCPVCLRRLDAVYALAQDDPHCVELRKTCPEHGPFSVPVWRTAAQDPSDHAGQPVAGEQGGVPVPAFESWSRPKSPSYPLHPRTAMAEGCPFDCGLCPAHAQHTCTGLFEITKRCDMSCPVCYAQAGSVSNPQCCEAGDIPLDVIAMQMDILKEASGPCNVQISGGEPTMRDDLPQIIGMARQRGFGHLQHVGACLVGDACLLRRARVQRWVPGAGHAFKHAAHLRGQAGVVDVQVGQRSGSRQKRQRPARRRADRRVAYLKLSRTGAAPGRPS